MILQKWENRHRGYKFKKEIYRRERQENVSFPQRFYSFDVSKAIS
jgi:hypothetical protein